MAGDSISNLIEESEQKVFKAHDHYFRSAMEDSDVAMAFIRVHLPPDIDDEKLKEEPLIGMIELLLKHAATRDIFSIISGVLGEMFQVFEILNKPNLLQASISYIPFSNEF